MKKTIRELDQTEIDAVCGGTGGDYSEYGYGWWDGFWYPWIDFGGGDNPDPNP